MNPLPIGRGFFYAFNATKIQNIPYNNLIDTGTEKIGEFLHKMKPRTNQNTTSQFSITDTDLFFSVPEQSVPP
jgi:hypothetical protein